MLITFVIIRDKFLLHIPLIAMKTYPALLFFDPDALRPPRGRPHRHTFALQAGGFDVRSCTAATSLHKLAFSPQYARHTPLLIVLGGSHSENCAVAVYLRTIRSRAGLVALVHTYREAQMLRAMECGVDAFCPHGASPQFVMALVCQLMSRMGHAGVAAPAAPLPDQPKYCLLEQGWILSGPDGRRVGLTTGERAFLMVLLGAVDHRATHGQLGLAVGQAYGADASGISAVRLALLVSRLRRKCNGSGLPLPIKSVHSWGYMFAA